MPAAILSLIGPFLPYIIGAIAVIGVYFGIKQKGRNEERKKVASQQAKKEAQLNAAIAKDVDVQVKLEEKVQEVREKNEEAKKAVDSSQPKPGDKFSF